MKLALKEYDNHDEYGAWGQWWYGKEHGTFGRSLKGMWAACDDAVWLGLETYEQEISESFKQSIIKWRKLNAAFKRDIKKEYEMEVE